MKCPNCGGQEIPPNGRFCPDCGLEIIRRPVPAQASQAPRETTVHVARASDTAGHDVLPPRRAPPGYGPVPSTHAPPRSRAPRIVLSFILTVMVIGAGFAVLTVMTWGSFQDLPSPVQVRGDNSGRQVASRPHRGAFCLLHGRRGQVEMAGLLLGRAPCKQQF